MLEVADNALAPKLRIIAPSKVYCGSSLPLIDPLVDQTGSWTVFSHRFESVVYELRDDGLSQIELCFSYTTSSMIPTEAFWDGKVECIGTGFQETMHVGEGFAARPVEPPKIMQRCSDGK